MISTGRVRNIVMLDHILDQLQPVESAKSPCPGLIIRTVKSIEIANQRAQLQAYMRITRCLSTPSTS
jgi:hypothetical protein